MTEERENFPILPVITGFFVCVLVLTPSAASKFITLGSINLAGLSTGPINIVGATLFFPLSYLFGDILTEVYGYEKSRKIIWIGFAAQVFTACMYYLIQIMPSASFWDHQKEYDVILGQAPRIVLGTLTAYFVGEFANSFVLSKLKFAQCGKAGFKLATRFMASTIVGEFFDSAIFIGVSFGGTMATPDLVRTAVSIWILKSLYEAVTLPVTMPIVAWIKRRDGVDHIDVPESTNYSPFRV